MSADWPIFNMHLRRTMVPLLTGCLGMYLTFVLAVLLFAPGMSPKAFRETLDFPPLVLFLIVAVPVGIGPFSRAFKEQHIVFLHAMPVSRARQWLLLVSSSAVSLAALIVVFFVLRPSMVNALGDPRAVLPFFAIVAVFFAAGCCLGIMVRQPVAVYAGSFVTVFLFGAVVLFMNGISRASFVGIEAYGLSYLADAPEALGSGSEAVLALEFGLLIVSLLALSLFAYVRGEVALFRTQARNVGLLVSVVALLAFGGVPLANAIQIRIAVWTTAVYGMSEDGRYALRRSYREGFRWKSRVELFDVEKKAKIAEIGGDGIFGAAFRGDRVFIFRRDMPRLGRFGILRLQRDAVETYSPQGRLLTSYSHPGTIINRYWPRFAYLGHGTGAVVEIADDGRGREILAMPTEGLDLSASLAYFRTEAGRSKMFRIDGEAPRELPWYRAAVRREEPVVFRDVVYPDFDTFVRVLEHDFPIAHAAGEQVSYAVRMPAAFDTMYAVLQHPKPNARGTLLALTPGARAWTTVCGDFPMPPRTTRDSRVWDLSGGFGMTFEEGNRVAACADDAGGRSVVRLHDPAKNALLEVTPVESAKTTWLGFESVRETLLYVSRSVNAKLEPVGAWRYANGTLAPAPRNAEMARRADGSGIFLRNTDRDAEVVIRAAGGNERVIFTFPEN